MIYKILLALERERCDIMYRTKNEPNDGKCHSRRQSVIERESIILWLKRYFGHMFYIKKEQES